jgi:hypothetical protein
MDENKKSTPEPMLTISSYVDDKHVMEEVPYSSLTIDRLVDLAVNGSLNARKELERRSGVDVFKDVEN